ncbi:MAG TPA: hypothetical protein VF066_15920 [Thermoleophilaceae bacterium]
MGELAKLLIRALCLLERLVDESSGGSRVTAERAARELELHHDIHEQLLRTVVKIADDATALLVSRPSHNARWVVTSSTPRM